MTNIIAFPEVIKTTDSSGNISMTMTRKINGMKVVINLSKLSREELLLALMPPVAAPAPVKEITVMDDKLDVIRGYINEFRPFD